MSNIAPVRDVLDALKRWHDSEIKSRTRQFQQASDFIAGTPSKDAGNTALGFLNALAAYEVVEMVGRTIAQVESADDPASAATRVGLLYDYARRMVGVYRAANSNVYRAIEFDAWNHVMQSIETGI